MMSFSPQSLAGVEVYAEMMLCHVFKPIKTGIASLRTCLVSSEKAESKYFCNFGKSGNWWACTGNAPNSCNQVQEGMNPVVLIAALLAMAGSCSKGRPADSTLKIMGAIFSLIG